MAAVYFDTSVFLAIFNKEANGPRIKALLGELRRDKIRIYTSIVTVQEVSVLSFKKGTAVQDNHSKVSKLARVSGVTKEIALTAAKLEAQLVDATPAGNRVEDNRRRKWDCFHIATAIVLNCRTIYACDDKLLKRKGQLGIGLDFSEPLPVTPSLFTDLPGVSPEV